MSIVDWIKQNFELIALIQVALITLSSALQAAGFTKLSKFFGTFAVVDLGGIQRTGGRVLEQRAASKAENVSAELRRIVGSGLALMFALSATVTLSGCVGTLEESRAKAQLVYVGPVHLTSDGEKLVKANSTARSTKRCESLSDRESFYGGAAKFGLAATGATGIAIWPIESREAEIGLAIGTTVLAAGTAFSEYVAQKSATQYIEEGCAQK